jgi:hypothetical protein
MIVDGGDNGGFPPRSGVDKARLMTQEQADNYRPPLAPRRGLSEALGV